MSSHLKVSTDVPPDPIFSIGVQFANDPHPEKVNLSVGIYKDDNGKSYTLPVVKMAEKMLMEEELVKDYLPIAGSSAFIDSTIKMVLGQNAAEIRDGRAQGVQAIAGTGALRVSMDYLRKIENFSTIYLPSPTWPIHLGLLRDAGFTDIRHYQYLDNQTNSINFESIISTLESAPEGSVVIFHVCAHNPTGVDPSQSQWKRLAEVCKSKQLLPLMDAAYLGLVSGNVDEDCFPIRHFVSLGIDILVAVSFSKIMGLYNERVGCLFWTAQSVDQSTRTRKHIASLIRHCYSNPPAHGVLVATRILSNPDLYSKWHDELNGMSERIRLMRKLLHSNLKRLSIGKSLDACFDHYINQRGMFTFSGLSESMIMELAEKHHIYMLKNGRMNMCGLTFRNVEQVAKAILSVMGHLSI